MSRYTEGPWSWFGSADFQQLYLGTMDRGRVIVMDFDRWGMRRAQPRFQVDSRMVQAKELLRFEVGDPSVLGITDAKEHPSIYRYDVRDIDHPDARLIVSAPELLQALELVLPLAKGYRPPKQSDSARLSCRRWIETAEAAIARATPEESNDG